VSGTIERISFQSSGDGEGASAETIELHLERYRLAAKQCKGRKVLDVACGVGYGSKILADAGAEVVCGVDIAPEAIEEAVAAHDDPRLRFFCLDYARMEEPQSLPDELRALLEAKFDMIVSLETIEHLPDPQHFLRTVSAGLKPGGLFVGSVPVTPSMDANPYHLQDFSRRSFERLFVSSGFRVIATFEQVQKFNPFSVRKEMSEGMRSGLRQNLGKYYVTHPDKLVLRVWSTLRHGFVNLYSVITAEKL
jgi:SAM-dependent methyltransferase